MADGATSTISLRGSVDLVQEFFEYAINSILYQRGIYPPEEFRRVAKYGLSMMVASDDGLQTYLKKILAQLKTWLEEGDVQRLVVVVTCVEINHCVGCTNNSSLSHFSAMTRPSWLGRAVKNRHRHTIEQASRRWRGGRRDDSARTRRKILISTQAGAHARRLERLRLEGEQQSYGRRGLYWECGLAGRLHRHGPGAVPGRDDRQHPRFGLRWVLVSVRI